MVVLLCGWQLARQSQLRPNYKLLMDVTTAGFTDCLCHKRLTAVVIRARSKMRPVSGSTLAAPVSLLTAATAIICGSLPFVPGARSKMRQVSDSDLRKVVGCLPGKGLSKGGC